MIRTTIIEDEPESLEYLRNVLATYYPDLHIINTASSVEEGVKILRQNPPDLLFLDVELSDGDGFQVLQQIGPNEIITVFTTGYQHYAIEAIRHSAFDYLLKPLIMRDLDKTMIRVRKNYEAKLSSEKPTHLEQGANMVDSDRILLNDGRIHRVVNISELIHLESDDHYVTLYFEDGSRMVITATLQELENQLPDNFLRIHRSHLVRLDAIKSVSGGRGGQAQLVNNQQVPVAYRKKALLLKLL